MPAKILIIDDDEKLCLLLKDYLRQFDFHALLAHHPHDGLTLLHREIPDLIILDVMLPGKDGFEVCREIRKQYSTPIIMLTARGETTDKVIGLEKGADDYLAKPFEPRELVARITSVLRRTKKDKKATSVKIKDLVVNFDSQTATLKGKTLVLTTLEFNVLKIFIEHAGAVLNRDQLLSKLGEVDWDPFNRSIDVLISRLRQKLGDSPKHPTYLKTVWGAGYMFIDED